MMANRSDSNVVPLKKKETVEERLARVEAQGEEHGLMLLTHANRITELTHRIESKKTSDLGVNLRELRKLWKKTHELMCIASLDGYFKHVNPAFTAKLGWTEAELLKRPFLDLVHEDDREATLAEMRNLREGGITVGFRNRYLTSDGRYVPLDWSASTDDGLIYATARCCEGSRPSNGVE